MMCDETATIKNENRVCRDKLTQDACVNAATSSNDDGDPCCLWIPYGTEGSRCTSAHSYADCACELAGGRYDEDSDGNLGSQCFASTSTVCLLSDRTIDPSHAFKTCFAGEATNASAVLVPVKSLKAGDLVLTTDAAYRPAVDRILINMHVATPSYAPTVTLHTTAGGTLELTPDHVLLVDGEFKPASEAKIGSALQLIDGASTFIERVTDNGKETHVVHAVTASGTILIAGPKGIAPVVASVHGSTASFMLAWSAPMPFPIMYTMSYLLPKTTQAYYDLVIEPLFSANPLHVTVATRVPPKLAIPLVLGADLLAAAGLIAPAVAVAILVRKLCAQK